MSETPMYILIALFVFVIVLMYIDIIELKAQIRLHENMFKMLIDFYKNTNKGEK